jgi:hypothetical protein
MKHPQDQVVAAAWYRLDQWEQLRHVSVDASVLELSIAEWATIAFRKCAELTESGVMVVRIDVDVGELIDWCRDEGLPLDAHARAQFASWKLQLQHAGNP